MITLLESLQTKQLRLYQYEKKKNNLAIWIAKEEIKDLEALIKFLNDMGIPDDASIPGDIIIQVQSIFEECKEIQKNIENIEEYVDVENDDEYEEGVEYDYQYDILDLEDELSDKEILIYNLLEKYIRASN